MHRLRIALAASLAVSLALPSAALAGPPLAFAPADGPLSDEQKRALAETRCTEAGELTEAGEWQQAADKYEEAYYLVPGQHGLALQIGVAAYQAGDCDRARQYLSHFLSYGDPEQHAGELDEARRMLEEIEASGCASEERDIEVDDSRVPVSYECQFTDGAEQHGKRSGGAGLLAGGAVLFALGVGGVAVGSAGAALAIDTRNELNDLGGEEPATTTGYASGFYSCESNAPCPPELEQQLGTEKLVASVGFAVGGVLLAGGAVLVGVYLAKRKKARRQDEHAGRRGAPRLTAPRLMALRLVTLGPSLMPGGGGLSARLEF